MAILTVPVDARLLAKRREHSLSYDLYLSSPVWRLRRALWWSASDRRCERCGCPLVLHRRDAREAARVVTVHHRTYRRLWHERRTDVQLLCWPCHRDIPRSAP